MPLTADLYERKLNKDIEDTGTELRVTAFVITRGQIPRPSLVPMPEENENGIMHWYRPGQMASF